VILLSTRLTLSSARTEVKDAHDRYANLEISYPLERMEVQGLAISRPIARRISTKPPRRLRFVVDLAGAPIAFDPR
jgi:hypothetical protein